MKKLTRKKSEGGIIIPDSAMIDPQSYGRVESFGPDVKGIKVGDVLTYHPQAARATVFKRKIYEVVILDEIYGKVVDKEILGQLQEEQPLNPQPSKIKEGRGHIVT